MEAKAGWRNFDGLQLSRLGVLQTLHQIGRKSNVHLRAESNHNAVPTPIVVRADGSGKAVTLSFSSLIG